MALELNGTTGVSLVQDGVVTAADLASGAITASALPTGSVLQVVEGTTSGFVVINTTTFTNTNLSATITPSSASSKILIIVSQALLAQRATNNTIQSAFRILDNNDNVITTADRFTGISSGTDTNGYIRANDTATMTALHSPNTTSAITYRTQIKADTTSNSGLVVAQDGNSRSSIILMEIAG